jgi:hypothetical protein
MSHIPGGTIFDDNNPGINANCISSPLIISPPGIITFGAGVPQILSSTTTDLIVGAHDW